MFSALRKLLLLRRCECCGDWYTRNDPKIVFCVCCWGDALYNSIDKAVVMMPRCVKREFEEQAVFLSASGKELHLTVQDSDVAHRLYDWLESLGNQRGFLMTDTDLARLSEWQELNLMPTDVSELLDELVADVRRLRELRSAEHRGWVCYGCRVPWSAEIETEACGHSHESHWAHEWVPPIVIELRQRIVEMQDENERLKQESDAWESTARRQASELGWENSDYLETDEE